MLKLSILIPSLNTRNVGRLISQLNPQLTDEVELLCMIDNKNRTLSEKRNELTALSKGKYISFVDDDDDVSADYVESILQAIEHDPDVVVFDVQVNLNWTSKNAYYGIQFTHEDGELCYTRKPNDKMVYRKSIAEKVAFQNILCEDTIRAEEVSQLAATERRINKVLYHYNANPATSECVWDYYLPKQRTEW